MQMQSKRSVSFWQAYKEQPAQPSGIPELVQSLRPNVADSPFFVNEVHRTQLSAARASITAYSPLFPFLLVPYSHIATTYLGFVPDNFGFHE